MSGRRTEAARNDGRILDAAREVFLADPEAPVSAVAARAGVGISALYRRYPSKEDLLRELARDGLTRYAADLEAALADGGEAWAAYADCLHRIVDGRSQALARRLAGTFTPTPQTASLARRAGELAERLHRRVRDAGVLRADVTAADVVLLLEAVEAVRLPVADGGAALRHRYLALVLQALHDTAAPGLPGPPPDPADLAARWRSPGRSTSDPDQEETSRVPKRAQAAAPKTTM